jgi:hypothetical protein
MQEFPVWNQGRAGTLEARTDPPGFQQQKEVHREIQTGQA